MITKIYKVEKPYRLSLGKNIQAMREKRKLNRGELGRIIGRTPNTIMDYESGRISPSVVTLFILAAALECSTHKLLWSIK